MKKCQIKPNIKQLSINLNIFRFCLDIKNLISNFFN